MEKLIHDMVREALNLDINEQVLTQDITSKAPMQISGLKFYESQHRLNKDPVPVNTWILIDDKLHFGSNLINILKEKKIIPKSEQEAMNLAKLIVFAKGDALLSAKDDAEDPVVNKKDEYYEIVLHTLKNPREKNVRKSKLTINLGENIYEVKEEDETFL